jgi:hypothetical protein
MMGPHIGAFDLMMLIKGVNRKYWPPKLNYQPHADSPYFYRDIFGEGKEKICDEYAVLLFEAAFTNALIGEGFHTFKWEGGADDTHDNMLRLYDFEYPFKKHAVQALALALEDFEEAEHIKKIEFSKEQGASHEQEQEG